MIEGTFIFKKCIDWSTLNYGFNIPLSIQEELYNRVNHILEVGQKKEINIIIDGTK